jgi:hypothetical protein
MASTPSSVTEYQTGFAPQIAPYAENLLGQAQALTDVEYNPYMQYQGERNAQFSPLQQQSYQNAALMQTQPQLQDATALAGQAGLGALNTQYTYNPYQAKSITGGGMGGNYGREYNDSPPYDIPDTSNPLFAGVGAMPPGMVDPASQTQQGPQNTLQQYMNPYMQNVVQRQQQDASRQAAIAQQAQGAQAARSGAFGGSGDYLMRSQAAGNLARQKGDIQAQGLNNAYGQAMQQFNAEQGQNLAAAQLNAQQGQFGAGLGLQGLQTAMTGANTLGTLGQNQYQQNMGINALQNQYGLQQQAQVQKDLDTKYGDFTAAQNYPYKQLSFMSDIIRGVPLSATGSSVYQAPPSTAQNIASLGLGAAGVSKLWGGANGGVAQGMAEGGMAYANGGGIGALALNHLV